MEAERNKAIITQIFDALANGDGRPFVGAMAEDFTWIMEGSTSWSGIYRGKAAVRDKLMGPLFAQFGATYKNRAERIIAEDDNVVVLCRGDVTTKAGKPYGNSYCLVFRLRDGQLVELREFLDTALVDRALDPPGAVSAQPALRM